MKESLFLSLCLLKAKIKALLFVNSLSLQLGITHTLYSESFLSLSSWRRKLAWKTEWKVAAPVGQKSPTSAASLAGARER